MSVRPAAAVAALVMVASVLAVGSGIATADDCAEGLSAHRSTDGRAAVLLVHGWTGRPEMWTGPIQHRINEDVTPLDRSMADQLQRVDGLDAWLLDYHDVSGRWVTSEGAAADRLDAAVGCLADRYGQPVLLVAHSMGGLAARVVADRRPQDIAGVATLGTPHAGSDVALVVAQLLGYQDEDGLDLTELATSGLSDLLVTATWYCTRATTPSDSCSGLLNPVTAFNGEAGVALRAGSAQLAALPSWPRGMPVANVAGDVEFVTRVRRVFGHDTDRTIGGIGDWIVSTQSATAAGPDTDTLSCPYNVSLSAGDDVMAALGYSYIPPDERPALLALAAPCAHWRLSTTVETTNRILGFAAGYVPATIASAEVVDNGDRECGACRLLVTTEAGETYEQSLDIYGPGYANVGDLDGDGRQEVVVSEPGGASSYNVYLWAIEGGQLVELISGGLYLGGNLFSHRTALCGDLTDNPGVELVHIDYYGGQYTHTVYSWPDLDQVDQRTGTLPGADSSVPTSELDRAYFGPFLDAEECDHL